jgi:hypothetical protein
VKMAVKVGPILLEVAVVVEQEEVEEEKEVR